MRNKEILPIEYSSRTSKQKSMENTEKNPVGRPKGQIKRYLKAFFVSEEEEQKMQAFYNELKRLREQTT